MRDYSDEGKVMSLDYGHKRVGVAFSDPFRSFALPDTAIFNSPTLISDLMKIVADKGVTHILVGLPLHMNGTDTPQTTLTRDFANLLAKEGIPLSFWDERMSSKAVERQMLSADASRKTRKQNVDSQAAAFILQGFLDRLKLTKTQPVLVGRDVVAEALPLQKNLEEIHDDL
jgi:putative Holliday junction resolvase